MKDRKNNKHNDKASIVNYDRKQQANKIVSKHTFAKDNELSTKASKGFFSWLSKQPLHYQIAIYAGGGLLACSTIYALILAYSQTNNLAPNNSNKVKENYQNPLPSMPCQILNKKNKKIISDMPHSGEQIPPCKDRQEQLFQITVGNIFSRTPKDIQPSWENAKIDIFSYDKTIQNKFKEFYLNQLVEGSLTANGQGKGKRETTLKESHVAKENLSKGLNYIWKIAESNKNNNEGLTFVQLQTLYNLVLNGKEAPLPFRTANMGYRSIQFPHPSIINNVLKNMLKWANENKKEWHPILLGELIQQIVTSLHPCVDSNGRFASLLKTYILLNHGYLPVAGTYQDKKRYLSVGSFEEKDKTVTQNFNDVFSGKERDINPVSINAGGIWQARNYRNDFFQPGERDNILNGQKMIGSKIMQRTTENLESQVKFFQEMINNKKHSYKK